MIASYSEGLHIDDCVVICNTGISTGAKAYNTSNGEVNLLGLYISNCEFNCTLSSAVLSWVNTAWINGTHFSTVNVAYPAMPILGCLWVTIDSCEFTGFYGSGNWTAIQLGKTADGWSTSNTKISNCVCVNIGIRISMQPNTFNTAVTSWTMSAPAGYNGAGLVGGGCSSTSSPVVACVDNTGNTTNLVQWVTSAQPASGYSTDRLLYSRAQWGGNSGLFSHVDLATLWASVCGLGSSRRLSGGCTRPPPVCPFFPLSPSINRKSR